MLARAHGRRAGLRADRRRGPADRGGARRAARPRAEARRRRARLQRARHDQPGRRASPPRAHAAGAVVLVDGAQAAPHLPVDVGALGADFYAWTAHKAYGPTGIGVLHGRRELLEAMPPFLGGGHMIARSRKDGIRWAEPPTKFEAGTSPIAEAVGLGAAVDYLERLRHGRRVRALARRRRLRGRAAARRRRPGDPRPVRPRAPRQRDLVRARRHPPARRRRDPRPRGRLRARRAPLRAGADAAPRRRRHHARLVRRALHARRRRPPDRRAGEVQEIFA